MARSREELLELVCEGAVAALSALSTNTSDRLVAFALCTDDDVSTLFHVGCTAKYAAEHELHDVRFLPNEWIQNGDVDPPALNVAAEVLRVHAEHAPGSTWAAARDAAFCALVTGLAAARVEGRVDDSTFLTVISTDPSEHMEELEETSLALLNSPSVVREWREWRLAEAEAWLHELESKPEPLSYADQDRVAQLRAETRRFQSLLHR